MERDEAHTHRLPQNEAEPAPTPPWVVIAGAGLLSISLALCGYLLL